MKNQKAGIRTYPSEPPSKGKAASRLRPEPFMQRHNGVIYNPLTNREMKGDDENYQTVLSLFDGGKRVDSLPPVARDFLFTGGWLVEDSPELARRFNLRYVSLEAHTLCNLACSFCPVSVKPREKLIMSMEFYESILSQLAEFRDTLEGVFMNNYNEPTIDPHFLDRVGLLKEHNLPIALLSNGTGLTPERIDALAGMGGLAYLSINLSTRKSDTGRLGSLHRKTIENLHYLGETVLAPQMIIVVLGEGDDLHHRDFEEIKTEYSRYPFHVKSFHVESRAGCLEIGLRQSTPHASLRGCEQIGSRPVQHLHVTASGRCILCCEDYYETQVVGDLKRETVRDILGGGAFAQVRKWSYGLERAPESFICRSCIFACTP